MEPITAHDHSPAAWMVVGPGLVRLRLTTHVWPVPTYAPISFMGIASVTVQPAPLWTFAAARAELFHLASLPLASNSVPSALTANWCIPFRRSPVMNTSTESSAQTLPSRAAALRTSPSVSGSAQSNDTYTCVAPNSTRAVVLLRPGFSVVHSPSGRGGHLAQTPSRPTPSRAGASATVTARIQPRRDLSPESSAARLTAATHNASRNAVVFMVVPRKGWPRPVAPAHWRRAGPTQILTRDRDERSARR